MIIERNGLRGVLVRHRDDDGNRVETKIKDYYPFGFLLDGDAQRIPAYSKESGYRGVYGESLTKVVMGDPAEIGKLKDKFSQTWECNIPWSNRALSLHVKDNGKIPNYEHRVWYWDMEWTTDSEMITVISVYDNFKDTMWTWALDPEQSNAGTLDTLEFINHPYKLSSKKITGAPTLLFANEYDMLVHFVTHMKKCDPDILTGWNVVNADCRVLIERCKKNNIDPKRLCGGSSKIIRYDYKDWSQPIGGRLVIDLMLAVSRLWQIKNGALPNKRLDTVAQVILNDKKLPLDDGHNTYYSDFHTYIDYNIQDVELLPRLDKAVNAINHHLAIQHIVQCDIQTTPFVTRLFTCLTINDPEVDWQIPSRPQFAKVDYEGADIMQPKKGVYQNVAIMDIKAMYHSNAALHNISWETLTPNGEDCGNGSCFHKNSRGHLVRQMDRMTELRNEYKTLMKEAKTDDEHSMYDAMQYATKSLVASMYGAAGDSKYGLYHPDVAAAITFTSRQTLHRLRDECEKRNMGVIYGHTDSVFVLCPSPEHGMMHINNINQDMHPIETEFEKWCQSVVIMAKNRYAGLTSWTDGEHHEPKLYVKGIEMKQTRLPSMMKKVMEYMLTSLLYDVPELQITDVLVGMVDSVIKKTVDPIDLCIQARLQQNLDEYKVLGESRAGAAWANKKLGKGYRKGDNFLSTIATTGDYIAFDDPKDIEGIVEIGYRNIAEKFIVAKVKPYYEVANFDIQPIINALNGVGAVDWL